MHADKEQPVLVRNYFKADWTRFRTILEAEMPKVKGGDWSQVRIEEEVSTFYKHTYRALDIVSPQRRRKLSNSVIGGMKSVRNNVVHSNHCKGKYFEKPKGKIEPLLQRSGIISKLHEINGLGLSNMPEIPVGENLHQKLTQFLTCQS